MQTADPQPVPRWLHYWAWMTVCAAFPLLFLGAEVTTKGVGMVDPRGLRAPWHIIQGFLDEKGLGWLIEHGHRLAGWIVGTLVIVLAIGLGLREPRRWVRYLGLAALLGVSIQGILGVFRIEFNELFGKTLALAHGCFAPLVFAMLLSVALITSLSWSALPPKREEGNALRRWALFTTVLIFGQLLLGGLVRHMNLPLVARGHWLGAFAVLAAALWLLKLALDSENREYHLRSITILLILIASQIILGVETWLSKFFDPILYSGAAIQHLRQIEPLMVQHEWIRSLHYVLGTLTFAASVAGTLLVHRRTIRELQGNLEPLGRWEGVA